MPTSVSDRESSSISGGEGWFSAEQLLTYLTALDRFIDRVAPAKQYEAAGLDAKSIMATAAALGIGAAEKKGRA